jgi:hypothetical protein
MLPRDATPEEGLLRDDREPGAGGREGGQDRGREGSGGTHDEAGARLRPSSRSGMDLGTDRSSVGGEPVDGLSVVGTAPPWQGNWHVGNSPVIYYVEVDGLIKIGFTRHYISRMIQLQPDKVLAIEPGDRQLEKQRIDQFIKYLVEGRERFRPALPIRKHTKALVELYGTPPTWEVLHSGRTRGRRRPETQKIDPNDLEQLREITDLLEELTKRQDALIFKLNQDGLSWRDLEKLTAIPYTTLHRKARRLHVS